MPNDSTAIFIVSGQKGEQPQPETCLVRSPWSADLAPPTHPHQVGVNLASVYMSLDHSRFDGTNIATTSCL
jgi:hypothetical protein